MKLSSARRMQTRIINAAKAAQLDLDTFLTSVTYDDATDTYRVVASGDHFPESEDHRELMRSAIHILVIEELSDVPPDRLDVRVIVPKVLGAATGGVGYYDFVQQHVNVTAETTLLQLMSMAKASYECVVNAYPWRDAAAMKAAIPALLIGIAARLRESQTDPALQGNVDAILPPMDGLLHHFDRDVVFVEVERFLGRPPQTLLETYESAIRLAHLGNPKLQIHALTTKLLR